MQEQDTIAAISTPPGQSGIGIVRMSGPEAVSIADSVFYSPKGVIPSAMQSHFIRHGFIRDEKGGLIDEVLVTVMRAPSTYTREDIVEINAHGGIVPMKEILRNLLKNGARLAEPGEFTKRAFLNGRIDLAQAEAVSDFIRAKTVNQARVAMRQLKGALSDEILKIKEALLEVLAQLEALLDFPDENQVRDFELDSKQIMLDKLKYVNLKIEGLLSRAKTGHILREGARVVIAGRPNTGKSSLLNTLLLRERAIVTPFPGTTRDTIEEEIEIDGYLVRLIDTAGLSGSEEPVEREGIKRAQESIEESDLVIFLIDANSGITEKDREILFSFNGKKSILVVNKIDLPVKVEEKELERYFPGRPIVKISATERINIEKLIDAVKVILFNAEAEPPGTEILASLRHEEILRTANEKVMEAARGIRNQMGEELVSIDLREALSSLAHITGDVYAEDILEEIFSRFCIGK